MFGLFGKKYNNPALIEQIRETQERWFVFLDKLEARLEELVNAAIPELQALFQEDNDPYKRAHGSMLLGVIGQINQMREKANAVRQQNIVDFVHTTENSIRDFISVAGGLYHTRLLAFRITCFNRHNTFEEKIGHYIELLRGAAGEEDLETMYQEQLAIFERTRDKYSCKQCGGNITIPRMFFIATYVHCPFCQTQNTFMPSTEARQVLHQARSLAEQRTAALRKVYEDDGTKNPELYRQYLRAMFDEWNKIVPDLAGENEKFYERLIKDHSIYHL